MPWIGADHVDLSMALDDLAMLTNPLDARSHFHGSCRFDRFHPLRGGKTGSILLPKMVLTRPEPNLANLHVTTRRRKSGPRRVPGFLNFPASDESAGGEESRPRGV